MFAAYKRDGDLFDMFAIGGAGEAEGIHTRPDGTFSNVAPPEAKLAELRKRRCFPTDRYRVGDRGLYALDGSPLSDGAHASADIALGNYLGFKAQAVQAVNAAQGAELGPALLGYVKSREALLTVAHRFFGEPGLRAMQEAYASPADAAVLKLIGERYNGGDPAMRSDPETAAKVRLLVTSPADFTPCQARGTAG
jgi:hypothetical protein